jgi:pilus assembly protein CpaF
MAVFVARGGGDAIMFDPVVFGVLAPLVRDTAVTDVFVNPDGTVWVDRGAGAEVVRGMVVPAGEARELASRLVAAGDRHVDEATPCMDVRLGDGIRVHAVLPPLSPGGAVLSIRLPRSRPFDLEELDAAGMFAHTGLDRILDLVRQRANVLITGAGGSGKTTLLAALLSAAQSHERIVVVEDVAELRIAHPHVVALETRQANLDGAGAIGLDRLVRESLRMRPDRLVVGECRGAELRELLAALNTGHDGGAGTLHANSLADVPARLEALGSLAGMTADAVARQAVSAFDVVVHVERDAAGRRRASLGRFVLDHVGRLSMRPDAASATIS